MKIYSRINNNLKIGKIIKLNNLENGTKFYSENKDLSLIKWEAWIL